MTLKVEDMGLTEDLRKAIDAVRRAAHGLRGAVYDLRLDEEDRPFYELVGAVVHRIRSMNPDRDLRLSVKAGFPSRPLGAAGVELLRVIQEALTNARRHSEARNVWVSLAVDGDALVADVADDGGGFDPEASPGTGLRGMRERVLLLGGSLRVESAPGEGTRVRVRVPMPAAPQDVPGDETGLHGQGR
jgi:signal transduction histidine kinase